MFAIIHVVRKCTELVKDTMASSPGENISTDDMSSCVTLDLHTAIMNGKFDEAERLIKEKDINEKDEDGLTPLHYLVIHGGTFKFTELLMECKELDVNAGDVRGWTPLHYAYFTNNSNMIEILLKDERIDVTIKSLSGKTADELINVNISHERYFM